MGSTEGRESTPRKVEASVVVAGRARVGNEGVDALSSVGTSDRDVFAAVSSSFVGGGRESDEEGRVRVDVSAVTTHRGLLANRNREERVPIKIAHPATPFW